jgi:tRNA (guanine37-N1)-methyltransferase
MSDASWGIKVQKSRGEEFRKAIVELGAFDRGYKIRSDESYVYLPVQEINQLLETRLGRISKFEKLLIKFDQEERNPGPEELLGFRPSYEVVGDIAIVEDVDSERVASAIISTCKSIKTVIAPISEVEGEFRTRRFRHVAGERRTVTTHKEHGLRYRVDLEGAYFTPRLGTERLRIRYLIQKGDIVLDMFAGVGPFALLMAKIGAKVIAMDKNPIAVKYLRENASLNKIENIQILEGDAAVLVLPFENTADHVIMNLPHSASQFLVPALKAARSGGVVHYYCIAPEEDLYMDEALIEKVANETSASVEVLYKGVVRSYAPHRYNVVIDFLVKKSS